MGVRVRAQTYAIVTLYRVRLLNPLRTTIAPGISQRPRLRYAKPMWRLSRTDTHIEYRDGFWPKIPAQLALLLGALALAWLVPSGGSLSCQAGACTLRRESALGRVVFREHRLAADIHEATLEQAPFAGGRTVQSIAQRIVLDSVDRAGQRLPLTIHYSNRRWEMQGVAAQINQYLAAPNSALEVRYDDHRIALIVAALLAALGLYGLAWGARETRIIADGEAGTLSIVQRRLLFTIRQVYDTAQIRRLALEPHQTRHTRPRYRPVIELKSGQRVPLWTRYSSAFTAAHTLMLENLSRFTKLPFDRHT